MLPIYMPPSGGTSGSGTSDHNALTNRNAAGQHPIVAVTGLQAALNAKIAATEKGAASGIAELDASGKIISSQLPSYVDDVFEYDNLAAFPATGETGKIYVAIDSGVTYRWSGSAYVEISQSLALGETSSTAYRGDRGKAAYDHSQDTTGNPHNITPSKINASPNDHTHELLMTTAERAKLSGIASGAQVNNITDANAATLTNGGNADTLHTHSGGGSGGDFDIAKMWALG